MCLCLQFHPQQRPTIFSVVKSNLFTLDANDCNNSVQLARPLIGYHNPRLIYHDHIYLPCRRIARLCIEESDSFLLKSDEILAVVDKFRHTLA